MSNRLGRALDLDPEDDDQRRQYDDGAVLDAVEDNPKHAAEEYEFSSWLPPWKYPADCTDGANSTYPLIRLCALGPSLAAVERVHHACPSVIEEFHKHWEHGGGGAGDDDDDPDAGEDRGYCALHIACMFKASAEVVGFLADEYPAAMELRDENGRNPLFLACEHGAPSKVVRLLVERFPDAAVALNSWGLTPLHWCVENHEEEQVTVENIKCIIEGCPSAVSMKTSEIDGTCTPLHLACRYGPPEEILKALVTGCPAALQMKDGGGCTPLCDAVEHSASLKELRLLAEGFPDALNEKDNCGRTPLQLARQLRARKEVLVLLETLNAILCKKPSRKEVSEILVRLRQEPWTCGVAPVLDSDPAFVLSLDCPLSAMPLLLERIGRECRPQTFFEIVKGGPELIDPRRENMHRV